MRSHSLFSEPNGSLIKKVEFFSKDKIELVIKKKDNLLAALTAINLFEHTYRVPEKFDRFCMLVNEFNDEMNRPQFELTAHEKSLLNITAANMGSLHLLVGNLTWPGLAMKPAKETCERIMQRIEDVTVLKIDKIKRETYEYLINPPDPNNHKKRAKPCVIL